MFHLRSSSLLELVRSQANENIFPPSFGTTSSRNAATMNEFNASFNTSSLANAMGGQSATNLNQSFGQGMLGSSASKLFC